MKRKNVGKGGNARKGANIQNARKDADDMARKDAETQRSNENQESEVGSVTPNFAYFHKVTKTLIPEHRMEILTAYIDAGDLIISVKDNINHYREHLYIHGKIPFTVVPPAEYIPIIIKQYVEVNYITELDLALQSRFERESYLTRIRNCFYHQCTGHLKSLIDYIDRRTDMYWTEYRGLMKWAEEQRTTYNGQGTMYNVQRTM